MHRDVAYGEGGRTCHGSRSANRQPSLFEPARAATQLFSVTPASRRPRRTDTSTSTLGPEKTNTYIQPHQWEKILWNLGRVSAASLAPLLSTDSSQTMTSSWACKVRRWAHVSTPAIIKCSPCRIKEITMDVAHLMYIVSFCTTFLNICLNSLDVLLKDVTNVCWVAVANEWKSLFILLST